MNRDGFCSVVYEGPAASKKIQSQKSKHFRYFGNIVASDRDVLRVGIADSYFFHQHRGGLHPAVGSDEGHPSALTVDVVAKKAGQPQRDGTVFCTRIQDEVRLLSGFRTDQGGRNGDGAGGREGKFQNRNPILRGMGCPL